MCPAQDRETGAPIKQDGSYDECEYEAICFISKFYRKDPDCGLDWSFHPLSRYTYTPCQPGPLAFAWAEMMPKRLVHHTTPGSAAIEHSP